MPASCAALSATTHGISPAIAITEAGVGSVCHCGATGDGGFDVSTRFPPGASAVMTTRRGRARTDRAFVIMMPPTAGLDRCGEYSSSSMRSPVGLCLRERGMVTGDTQVERTAAEAAKPRPVREISGSLSGGSEQRVSPSGRGARHYTVEQMRTGQACVATPATGTSFCRLRRRINR